MFVWMRLAVIVILWRADDFCFLPWFPLFQLHNSTLLIFCQSSKSYSFEATKRAAIRTTQLIEFHHKEQGLIGLFCFFDKDA